jgi:DNA-binding response OmpR family regulator
MFPRRNAPQGAGFDVRETATGRDALRLARFQTDAIVLDLALLRDGAS